MRIQVRTPIQTFCGLHALSVCIFIWFFLHEIELKQGIQLLGGGHLSLSS